jgi:hypothetical protein
VPPFGKTSLVVPKIVTRDVPSRPNVEYSCPQALVRLSACPHRDPRERDTAFASGAAATRSRSASPSGRWLNAMRPRCAGASWTAGDQRVAADGEEGSSWLSQDPARSAAWPPTASEVCCDAQRDQSIGGSRRNDANDRRRYRHPVRGRDGPALALVRSGCRVSSQSPCPGTLAVPTGLCTDATSHENESHTVIISHLLRWTTPAEPRRHDQSSRKKPQHEPSANSQVDAFGNRQSIEGCHGAARTPRLPACSEGGPSPRGL